MLRPGRFSVNSAGEVDVHGVAPTVSGENRDSKVCGAEISWSCAQQGQTHSTDGSEILFAVDCEM